MASRAFWQGPPPSTALTFLFVFSSSRDRLSARMSCRHCEALPHRPRQPGWTKPGTLWLIELPGLPLAHPHLLLSFSCSLYVLLDSLSLASFQFHERFILQFALLLPAVYFYCSALLYKSPWFRHMRNLCSLFLPSISFFSLVERVLLSFIPLFKPS